MVEDRIEKTTIPREPINPEQVSFLAHEIKSPLSSIEGSLEMILGDTHNLSLDKMKTIKELFQESEALLGFSSSLLEEDVLKNFWLGKEENFLAVKFHLGDLLVDCFLPPQPLEEKPASVAQERKAQIDAWAQQLHQAKDAKALSGLVFEIIRTRIDAMAPKLLVLELESETAKEPLQIAKRAMLRMQDNGRFCLCLVDPERFKEVLKLETISNQEFIDYVQEILKPFFEGEEKMAVNIADNTETDWQVSIDKGIFTNVFENLFSNLRKYGGASGNLSFSLIDQDKKKFLKVALKDEGRGLAPGEHRTIFDLGERGSGAEAAAKGSGIGLWICKQVVEAHNGQIWAKSGGKENGSTFAFTLPLKNE